MKLYARRGFEWAEDGLVGLWCPVLTGATQSLLLDCNPLTSNHGTLTGYTNINTGWVGSPFGTVINIDGVSGQFSAPSDTILTGNFSVSMWVNIQASTGFYMTLFERPPGRTLSVWLGGSVISGVAVGGTGQFVNRALGIVLNRWHLFTIVRRRFQCFYYLDGVLQSQSGISEFSVTTETALNGTQWTIGPSSTGGGTRLNAFVAEFAPRSIDLLDGQIMQAFQAGPGGMWQDRPRRSRSYFASAGFKAYWARRQSQLIGGGV